ncbi:ribonuclease 3-like protein 1 isoform X2 [Vigna radiata var. radiata]|uniref:Ribonuclease 3-like protein 1 isoform X2 n=1 Tax=Vigna radiata var. radiata TaxID=3916 RepID=A0A1S3U1P9_VIGRR|nr:ribonuclease 3-like protein 1 isoform X2 [Vigna radiata var. radiata]
MENNFSHTPKLAVNLKNLPPIDPFQITSPSSNSKNKMNNSSCSRTAVKAVKRKPSLRKFRASDKDIVKEPSLEMTKIADEGASSTSSNEKSESCGTSTTPSQTQEGMKKGTARSNLYEICAANHWKPPIFECCKEEGPSHERMFTFKVIITIEASRNTLECYGAPHRKKKEAADDAAEGALFYLKYNQ